MTRPPCLYAIELRTNPYGARYYVGHSGAHPAECKFSIHMGRGCVCPIGHADDREHSRFARRYGVRLAKAIPLRRRDSRVQWDRSETAWAQELARAEGVRTYCDGTVYGD